MGMQRSCPKSKSGRPGFTMIEMLTVIAIIAILAGILFSVFATVRKNVHKAHCTSNLHQIVVARRIYPAWDSVDGQVEPNKIGNPYIVKYTRHWSGQRPGYADNPRQLLYKNPPEDTVVTWCTYHRDYLSGSAEPQTGSLDLVLFLDG